MSAVRPDQNDLLAAQICRAILLHLKSREPAAILAFFQSLGILDVGDIKETVLLELRVKGQPVHFAAANIDEQICFLSSGIVSERIDFPEAFRDEQAIRSGRCRHDERLGELQFRESQLGAIWSRRFGGAFNSRGGPRHTLVQAIRPLVWNFRSPNNPCEQEHLHGSQPD